MCGTLQSLALPKLLHSTELHTLTGHIMGVLCDLVGLDSVLVNRRSLIQISELAE